MNVSNINGCQYGCDCESCSGWMLAPGQSSLVEWQSAIIDRQSELIERQSAIIKGYESLGPGGRGGEDWGMSRFQGFADKIE